MTWNYLRNCVSKGFPLDVTRDPCALGALQENFGRRFVRVERPIIEIRSILKMSSVPFRIDLDIKHLFGDCSSLTGAKKTRILNCVFQIEKDTGLCPKVGFIN